MFLIPTKHCAQIYYATSFENLYEIEISNSYCECEVSLIGNTEYQSGLSFSPSGNLFGIIGDFLSLINPLTGDLSVFYNLPDTLPSTEGIVFISDSIFYFMSNLAPGDLFVFNFTLGTITNLGSTGYEIVGELTLFNGDIYASVETIDPVSYVIVKIDTLNPTNSNVVVSLPPNVAFSGLTASPLCNTLIGLDIIAHQLMLINLIDGSITPICSVPDDLRKLTTSIEHIPSTICDVYIDLDCNDSSGAPEADYNASDFDCLADPVSIADEDINIFIDAIISEMTVEIVAPMPDAPNEILVMTGGTPLIDISGEGTEMITMTNLGGATIRDFKDALRFVRYNDTALYPTAGLRTVEVQFTTESGIMSNVASAFIQVNELPIISIDLGPDQERCAGQTATFNAGNFGSSFQWSNGATSQSITVGIQNEYIVTVSNNFNCPNRDTVYLDILPIFHVSLTGDTEICDNESASLIIHTDATFPISVEISSDPGSLLVFSDVTGIYTINVQPGELTHYTITEIIPSEPACIEMIDADQWIDVYPTYEHDVDVSLCDGDSIYLGYYWETEEGLFDVVYNSLNGCDSTVFFNIDVLPAVHLSFASVTCDPDEAGIFITHLNNPTGCDTTIEITVSLLPSDTTLISSSSCNSGSIGIFTQVLSNQNGCDSVIITTISLIPPADTIKIFQTTCDSSALGVFQQLLIDQAGCDSLILTTVSIAPADTSYINGISCDPASIGVFQSLLSNQSGCDSLVITKISAEVPDTSYFSTTSCDSASLGIFEDHFISQSECDSTVFTTVTYSASDFTVINSASCNPADTGVVVQNLINRFGCDSIVTEIISLLPTDQTFITSNTCDPAQAGVIVITLTNQNGCDSIVTETVELLPSDATELFTTTCISSQAGVFVTNLINQHGCDSIVTLTVSLVSADTSIISFKTCDPGQVGSTEELFTGQDGCDSLVISETTLYPLPVLNTVVSSDYNGYAISCFGESDGSAEANVTGTLPFSYLWSTGSTDPGITNVPEGLYAVTITDGNGCTSNSEIILNAPPEFSISLVVSQPDCFDQDKGSITVEQTGGIDPIRYSIDGINYQPSPVFNDLSGGTYQISALDANDCEVKEIIWINVPLMVHVDLGDDLIILPGDTTIIEAIVNVPFDSLASINWSGLINPNCPECLTQPVAPIITTTYSVTVTSLDGCADEDAMTLYVDSDNDIYVPNIFSPNGDNVNDRLLISAGKDVERIVSFMVYDRWGDMVFEGREFFANDAGVAWDGKLKGRFLNPGVFAYRLVAVFKDGSSTFRYGDVTLIR